LQWSERGAGVIEKHEVGDSQDGSMNSVRFPVGTAQYETGVVADESK
jgi:hypothetical protein